MAGPADQGRDQARADRAAESRLFLVDLTDQSRRYLFTLARVPQPSHTQIPNEQVELPGFGSLSLTTWTTKSSIKAITPNFAIADIVILVRPPN